MFEGGVVKDWIYREVACELFVIVEWRAGELENEVGLGEWIEC